MDPVASLAGNPHRHRGGDRRRDAHVLDMLMHSVVAAPFFVLSYLARRLPRVTGLLLLMAAVFFIKFFGWYKVGRLGLVSQTITMIVFLGPLIGSGLSLLGVKGDKAPTEIS